MRLGEAARREQAYMFARALGAGWIEVERGIWEYEPSKAVLSEPPLGERTSETMPDGELLEALPTPDPRGHLRPGGPIPSEPPLLLRWFAEGLRRRAQAVGSQLDDRCGDAAMRIAVETRDLSRRLARSRRERLRSR